MGAFTLSYGTLFCSVWLLSLEGLLFSEEEREGEWIWERGEVGGARSSRVRANFGWDVLYEGRIYFQ